MDFGGVTTSVPGHSEGGTSIVKVVVDSVWSFCTIKSFVKNEVHPQHVNDEEERWFQWPFALVGRRWQQLQKSKVLGCLIDGCDSEKGLLSIGRHVEICEPLDGDFGSKSLRIRLGLSTASRR